MRTLLAGRHRRRLGASGLAMVMATACLGLAGCDEAPTGPSGLAVVTFQVVAEQFRVRLTSDDQLRAARAAQSGGRARIPVGRIVAGTDVNAGWSWHLEDVTFAEVTTEVCDGLPSHVERAGGPPFANGQYCPWSAQVIDIQTSR